MSKQTINIGASPNDGTGTPLRTSFDYTNQNFTELYTALGGGVGLPGATTQVIFNDGGTNLAGDAGLVYNKTTDALTVAGNVQAASATITGAATVGTTLGVTSSLTVGTGANAAVLKASFLGGYSVFENSAGTGNPSITFNNDLDTGIRNPAANTLVFDAGGFEQYRIASSGVFTWSDGAGGTRMTLNSTGLGVGVVPYVSWPATSKALQLGASSSIEGRTNDGSRTAVYTNAVWNGTNLIYQNTAAASYYLQSSSVHSWFNAPSGTAGNNITFTQAMTLDASGRLLVGATSAVASGSTFENLGSARQVLTLKGNDATSYTLGIWSATTTGDNLFAYFGTEASLTVRGGISYNRGGGLVAYNTTSDYRAKDIIGPVSNSGSLIDSLKVYVGKMKGATIERPMLIAHEAQEVAPYAVSGTKDEVDAEGKPKYQQMDASALVPLLIAEIQSLRTRVQTLEAK